MSKRVTHYLSLDATARGNHVDSQGVIDIDIGWCGRIVMVTSKLEDRTTEIAGEVDCSMCKRLMKRILA